MNPLELFYKDATILITGGNGFLGKVLIEKLLRCFDVKKIYLLIRVKNEEGVKARMENLINDPIFDLLRCQMPTVLSKLIPVEVDYNIPDLNIHQDMLEELCAEVQVSQSACRCQFDSISCHVVSFSQIVFNVVASVKFNEALHDAIHINLLGTKKVVQLVLQMDKLKAFVHVSTLYTNCNRREIDEKIYDHILDYQNLLPIANVLRKMNDKHMQRLLFQQLPNTYTLTKHFAEKLVNHQTFFIPSGIFRPPVVMSSYKDLPGYTDNANGPSGIVAWAARGYIHCIYGDGSKRSNMVPVDYCINALIATAWDIHET